jgi:hypothetical protein
VAKISAIYTELITPFSDANQHTAACVFPNPVSAAASGQ